MRASPLHRRVLDEIAYRNSANEPDSDERAAQLGCRYVDDSSDDDALP